MAEHLEIEEDDLNEDFFDISKMVQHQIYKDLLPIIVESWEKNYLGQDEETEDESSQMTTIIFKNGNKYSGYTVDSKLEGNSGVFEWQDGYRYEGQFLNNRPHGNGKFATPNNETYSGQFNSGVNHGKGELKSEDLIYTGGFLNGKFDGEGYIESPPFLFSGTYANDKMSNGIRNYENGVFAGDFDEFGNRKYGKFVFSNGDKYFGSFSNDEFCDFGVYEWNKYYQSEKKSIALKEDIYTGLWAYGVRNGFGILKFENWKIFCLWNANMKHGPGVILAANGEIFAHDQMFRNDRYMESWKIKKNEKTKQYINTFLNFEENFYLDKKTHKKRKHFLRSSDIFRETVNSLLHYVNFKTDIYPLFYPEYALSADLPCLYDIDYITLQTEQNRNIRNSDYTTNVSQRTLSRALTLNKTDYLNLMYDSLEVKKNTELSFDNKDFLANKSLYTLDLSKDSSSKSKLSFSINDEFNDDKNPSLRSDLKSLNQVIIENYSKIEEIYYKYAKLDQNVFSSKWRRQIRMQRIGLWSFYKDVFQNFLKIDISECLEEAYKSYHLLVNRFNPFDEVYFYEFLRHFLHVICVLNRNTSIAEEAYVLNTSLLGVFARMVLIFLREFEKIEFLSGSLYLKQMIKTNSEITFELLDVIQKLESNTDLDLRVTFNIFKDLQNSNCLTNVSNLEFIECARKVFPKIVKNGILVCTEFKVNILELFDLIILCLEKDMSNQILLIEVSNVGTIHTKSITSILRTMRDTTSSLISGVQK